jgi:hypothetical protein
MMNMGEDKKEDEKKKITNAEDVGKMQKKIDRIKIVAFILSSCVYYLEKTNPQKMTSFWLN